NAVSERIFKITMPAEDWIRIDRLLQIPGRVERDLPPHVLQHKPPVRPRNLASLHRMAALDVVGAGQPADHAVPELHAEMSRAPDLSPGRLCGEALHGFDVAAEMTHDIDCVRVQSLDV